MREAVVFDSVSTDGRPYRSAASYRQDMRAAMALKPGAPVDIVREAGGKSWESGAVKVGYESIGDMGAVRFVVRLTDGTTHKVAEDRIRPTK